MNPESVKRREYAGIFLILFGLLACAGGLLGLFQGWPVALATLATGAGALAAGTAILTTIPNLVQDPEEGNRYM